MKLIYLLPGSPTLAQGMLFYPPVYRSNHRDYGGSHLFVDLLIQRSAVPSSFMQNNHDF